MKKDDAITQAEKSIDIATDKMVESRTTIDGVIYVKLSAVSDLVNAIGALDKAINENKVF